MESATGKVFKVFPDEQLDKQWDGRRMKSLAAHTFLDSTVWVSQNGYAANLVSRSCQLVCDPLLDWQPMQLVQLRLGMGSPLISLKRMVRAALF